MHTHVYYRDYNIITTKTYPLKDLLHMCKRIIYYVHVYLEEAPDILFFLIVALLNLLLTEFHKLLP